VAKRRPPLRLFWQLWADVDSWPTWNHDIKRISIDGPFAAGARVSMTPLEQGPIELRIIETVKNELFVDEAAIGDIVIRTFHRIEPASEGKRRIVYRMEIGGACARSDNRSPDHLRLPRNDCVADRTRRARVDEHPRAKGAMRWRQQSTSRTGLANRLLVG
jgi:hypothetical protein